jgi:hypothetical protein
MTTHRVLILEPKVRSEFRPAIHRAAGVPRTCLLVLQTHALIRGLHVVPAPGNIYVTPLRFKLGGHPVLSARFNVETAGSERKRAEI